MRLSHILEKLNNINLLWSMPDDSIDYKYTVICLTKRSYFIYIEVEKDFLGFDDVYIVREIYTNILNYKSTQCVRPKELFSLLEQLESVVGK